MLAVGGTRFSANIGPAWPGEVAWAYTPPPSGPEGSGGGYSNLINRPAWQVAPGFSNTHRGYPDISAVGDPATGYYVCYGNSSACAQIGGTSLSSPLWAGMLALINQYLIAQGKPALGFANPRLYQLVGAAQPYAALHDITSGTNGAYNAGAGWDAVTGLGTPDVWNLARDLANQCLTQFTDVAPDNPFYTYIRCLACRNILSGYTASPPCPGGTAPCFLAGSTVTRGQAGQDRHQRRRLHRRDPFDAANLHRRALQQPLLALYRARGPAQRDQRLYQQPALYDRHAVLPAGQRGNPGQLAKIDTIAANYTDAVPSTQHTFTDVAYGSPFWLYVERATLHGVISGYSSSPPCATAPCFLPGNSVTRRPDRQDRRQQLLSQL